MKAWIIIILTIRERERALFMLSLFIAKRVIDEKRSRVCAHSRYDEANEARYIEKSTQFFNYSSHSLSLYYSLTPLLLHSKKHELFWRSSTQFSIVNLNRKRAIRGGYSAPLHTHTHKPNLTIYIIFQSSHIEWLAKCISYYNNILSI